MIEIVQGNIVEAKVDIIVNAANPKMLGGGGVDGAIHSAAGPELLEECRKVRPVNGIRCPFGEARITAAGNLPCQYVVHTCGPIYRNEAAPDKVLASSYVNSLHLALAKHVNSIAFPAISCGAYGYPIREAASIALRVSQRSEYADLDIYFYLFGDQIFDIWQKSYSELAAEKRLRNS